MTKTLADLRSAPPVGRPERVIPLCLAPAIVAEIQILTAEHDRVMFASDDEDTDGPPARLAGNSNPRAKEIKARLAVLLDEMREYEGDMRLRAVLTDGEWRRWVNAHPARDKDDAGHERDQRVTAGFCNADDLIDALGTYAVEWNGEPLGPTDWAEVFEPVVSTADKADMATRVVELYEGRTNFLQLRSNLSTNLKRLSGSALPETSGSPTDDSTDGSPDSSTEATTETATESP